MLLSNLHSGPAGEWTIALRLMALMRVEGLRPNAYTYAAAINACDVGGQCDEALRLLEEMLYEQQQKQQQSGSTFPPLSAVPFNAAIAAAVHCGRMLVAKQLFDRMKTLGITRNTVTYTTLISSIAKSKWKQLDPTVVMEIHKDMLLERIPRNAAVFGAVLSAAERMGDVDTALQLLTEMKNENILTTNFVYHSVISACSKAGRYHTARALLDEMKLRGIERNEVTYSLMIGSCKHEGRWQDALRFIAEMESDPTVVPAVDPTPVLITTVNPTLTNRDITNRNLTTMAIPNSVPSENGPIIPTVPTVLKPNEQSMIKSGTVVYSTAIAVCVASKQWSVALELLEKMENAGISRNVVTYNTVIEALSSAGRASHCVGSKEVDGSQYPSLLPDYIFSLVSPLTSLPPTHTIIQYLSLLYMIVYFLIVYSLLLPPYPPLTPPLSPSHPRTRPSVRRRDCKSRARVPRCSPCRHLQSLAQEQSLQPSTDITIFLHYPSYFFSSYFYTSYFYSSYYCSSYYNSACYHSSCAYGE